MRFLPVIPARQYLAAQASFIDIDGFGADLVANTSAPRSNQSILRRRYLVGMDLKLLSPLMAAIATLKADVWFGACSLLIRGQILAAVRQKRRLASCADSPKPALRRNRTAGQ
jgi:hypothetical protein